MNNFPQSLTALLDSWCSALFFRLASPADSDIPRGLYSLCGQALHRAWGLYLGGSLACTSVVVHLKIAMAFPAMPPRRQSQRTTFIVENSFHPLNVTAYSGLHPDVAVHLRPYTPPTAPKPLNVLIVPVETCST